MTDPEYVLLAPDADGVQCFTMPLMRVDDYLDVPRHARWLSWLTFGVIWAATYNWSRAAALGEEL